MAARSKSFQNSPFADSNPYVLEFKSLFALFALVVSLFPVLWVSARRSA